MFQMLVEVHFSALHRSVENTVHNFVKYKYKPIVNECHKLTPDCELFKTCSYPLYHHWNYTPNFCPKSDFLCGPATLRSSKIIVYPCDKGKCFIGCPCFGCQGRSLNSISKPEQFEDHLLYHNALHLDCDFCNEVFRNFPAFSYDKYSINEKTIIRSYVFRHRTQYLPTILSCSSVGRKKKTKKILHVIVAIKHLKNLVPRIQNSRFFVNL